MSTKKTPKRPRALPGCLWLLAILVGFGGALHVGAGQARIAVVPTVPALDNAADLLAGALSQHDLVVLDRAESRRIFEERALDGLGTSSPAADGLLVLSLGKEADRRVLSVRLVAVRTGAIIAHQKHAWELIDPVEWSTTVARQFQSFSEKLLVPAGDELALSLLNLRSAVVGSQGEVFEHELRHQFQNRLLREPKVFLLERHRMDILLEETLWFDRQNDQFWNASYMIDGILDRDGYSEEIATVDLRMAKTGDAAKREIRVTGARTNLVSLAETLTLRLMEALNQKSDVSPLDTAAEAARQWEEAQWSLRWRLIRDAQAAADSAWALGLRTPEVMALRVHAWRETGSPATGAFLNPSFSTLSYGWPDAARFADLRRAASLFEQGAALFSASSNAFSSKQTEMGIRVVEDLTLWLSHYHYLPEARYSLEETLAETKLQAARIWAHLAAEPAGSATNTAALWLAKARGAPFWGDTPEDGVRVYREILQAGMFPTVRHNFINRFPFKCYITSFGDVSAYNLFPLSGWKWTDRKRAKEVWTAFETGLCGSSNELEVLEGLFLRCCSAPDEQQFTTNAHRLLDYIWEHRQAICKADLDSKMLEDLTQLFKSYPPGAGALRSKNFLGEVWTSFEQKFKSWLPVHDASMFLMGEKSRKFHQLSTLIGNRWTKEQAEELLPRFHKYAAGLSPETLTKPEKFRLEVMEKILKEIISPPADRQPVIADTPPPRMPRPTDRNAEGGADLTNFLAGIRSWAPDEHAVPWKRLNSFRMRNILEREGSLWVGMWYELQETGRTIPRSYHSLIARIDPATFKTEYLPLEGRLLQDHARALELHQGFLYLATQNGVERLSLATRQFSSVPGSFVAPFSLSVARGRLFVSSAQTIQEILPDGTTRLLASTRRTQPKSDLDSAGPYGAALVGTGERIWTWVSGKAWALDREDQWSVLAPVPSSPAPHVFSEYIIARTGSELWRLLPNTNQVQCIHIQKPDRPMTMFDNFAPRVHPVWQTPAWLRLAKSPVCVEEGIVWFYFGAFPVETREGRLMMPLENGRNGLLVAMRDGQEFAALIPLKLNLPSIPAISTRALPVSLVGSGNYGDTVFNIGPSGLVLADSWLPAFWLMPRESVRTHLAGAKVATPDPVPFRTPLGPGGFVPRRGPSTSVPHPRNHERKIP